MPADAAVQTGGHLLPVTGHLLPLSHSGRFPASTLTSILSSSLIQRPLTRDCPAGQFIRTRAQLDYLRRESQPGSRQLDRL